MHVEERALIEGIGEPYREYMSRTRRLIPFIY
jgi:protein-S-isoprenylcysteine O-methyltransferase Ste14